ncbi:MAG TPA: VWA domain-containing protein [Rhodothermales bacterium]|nr:VWA domain-containing protein [Rhodothermales bacterium]
MTFAHPGVLLLAVLAPACVWGLHVHARQTRWLALARLGTPEVVNGLLRGRSSSRRSTSMIATAFWLVGIALAGPRLPGASREVEAKGLDLVVALDVSQSMLAEDVAPSRLARARAEIKRLIDALPGDRIGLVLFAGDAFIQSPLTTDHAAIRLFLDAAAPEMMPTQGTDFEAAISAALDTFGPPGVSDAAPAARVLLLVSDGERHVGDTDRLVAQAREAQVLVFTTGVGEAAGATIPVYENGRRVGEKVDPETGEPVVTRLEPAALRALAAPEGYFQIDHTESNLGALPGRLAGLARSTLSVEDSTTFTELYAYPLAVALLLLLLEPLLGRLPQSHNRQPRRQQRRPDSGIDSAAPRQKIPATAGATVVLTALVLAGCGRATLDGRAGNEALEKGRPGEALGRYVRGLNETDSTDYDLRFRLQNNAALAELARDSARAALAYADAAARDASSPDAESRARYHGGIAAAVAGEADEAMARFRRALMLDPHALDAAYNWEVVARRKQAAGGNDRGDGDAPPNQSDGGGESQTEQAEAPQASPTANETAPQPDPFKAPPRISQAEAERLLDALASEEAGLVRRTVRGNPATARPTKDW